MDDAVGRDLADPDRLGVGGWSYGGIATNYLIASTTRFKAATSGASISNVFAGYGTDQYTLDYENELAVVIAEDTSPRVVWRMTAPSRDTPSPARLKSP